MVAQLNSNSQQRLRTRSEGSTRRILVWVRSRLDILFPDGGSTSNAATVHSPAGTYAELIPAARLPRSTFHLLDAWATAQFPARRLSPQSTDPSVATCKPFRGRRWVRSIQLLQLLQLLPKPLQRRPIERVSRLEPVLHREIACRDAILCKVRRFFYLDTSRLI